MHPVTIRFLRCIAGCLTVAALFYCSPKSTNPSGPDKPDTDEETALQAVEASEIRIDSLFSAALSASSDTMAVLASIAQALADDSTVDSATVSEQGLAVQYENGMRGGIFVNPLDDEAPEGGLPSDSIFNLGKRKTIAAGDGPVKQAVLWVVHYNDRVNEATKILADYTLFLPSAGFSVSKKFGTVMLDDLCSLSNKDYIHLYSHGWAWPKSKAIADVYLMTNEEVSAAASERYKSDLLAGDIVTAGFKGKRTYFVNSKFITKHNTFTKTVPFFYGGFCFSFLGTWPQNLTEAGVSAYTGFTWSVYTDFNALWARSIAIYMADTAGKIFPGPMPLGFWYDSTPKMPKFYHNATLNIDVHIHYSGSEKYTLWSSMKIDSLSPAHGGAGTPVTIYGRGFGDVQDGAAVTFTGGTASVDSWSDRTVRVTAPQSVSSGPVTLQRGTVKSNGVRFTAGGPFISGITPDTVHYGDTVVITGENFGKRGKVFFDTTEAVITGARWDSTRVTVNVPKNASGGMIRLLAAREDEWGKYDTSNAVPYHSAIPRPVITGIYPPCILPDSSNYFKIGGSWWRRDSPSNASVTIGDVRIVPDYWNNDSMQVRMTPEIAWGWQPVRVIDDSMASQPDSIYVGIPAEKIRDAALFGRCLFSVLVKCHDADGNESVIAVAPNQGSTFAPVGWNGREFSFTVSNADGTLHAVFSGTLNEYGSALTAMEMHYTQTTGDDVTVTLAHGKSIALTPSYRVNFNNQFVRDTEFGPPGYEIPRDSMPSFMSAAGTMIGSGGASCTVESVTAQGIPQCAFEFRKAQ